jgi:hypothetical protein
VILSGLLTQHYKKTPPTGIEFKKSLQEVIEHLASV